MTRRRANHSAERGRAARAQTARRASGDGAGAPEAALLALHDAAGNRAVSGLLTAGSAVKPGMQPALNIDESEASEREAERMAAQMTRAANPGTDSSLQEAMAAQPSAARSQAVAVMPTSATPARMSNGGEPLSQAARTFFEAQVGQDLSHVRVHTGVDAARSAEALEARAYTVGPRIVFGAGQYAPATRGGLRLLAHELTHVVQQSAGRLAASEQAVQVQFERQYDSPTDRLAREYVNAALSHHELVERLTAQHWSSPEGRRRFLRSYFTQWYLAWTESPPPSERLDALVEQYDQIVQEHEARRERERQPVTAAELARQAAARDAAVPLGEKLDRWLEQRAAWEAEREATEAALETGMWTGNYSGVDPGWFAEGRSPHRTLHGVEIYQRFIHVGADPETSGERTEIAGSAVREYGSESGTIEEPFRMLYVDPNHHFAVMRKVFSTRKGEQQTVFVLEQWLIAESAEGRPYIELQERTMEGIRAHELTAEGFGPEGRLEAWTFPSAVPVGGAVGAVRPRGRPRNTYPEFEVVPPTGPRAKTAAEEVDKLSAQLGIPLPKDRVLSAPWIGRVRGPSGRNRSIATSQGWLRSESKFWNRWKSTFEADAALLGRGNRVTKELAARYGWDEKYIGEKLIHHHIGNSHLVIAIPESLHKQLSGTIHATPRVIRK